MRDMPVQFWAELFKAHQSGTIGLKVSEDGRTAEVSKPSLAWRMFHAAMKMAGSIMTYASYALGVFVGFSTGSVLLGVGTWAASQITAGVLYDAPDKLAKATGFMALAWMYTKGTNDQGEMKDHAVLSTVRPWASRYLLMEAGASPAKPTPNHTHKRVREAEEEAKREAAEEASNEQQGGDPVPTVA